MVQDILVQVASFQQLSYNVEVLVVFQEFQDLNNVWMVRILQNGEFLVHQFYKGFVLLYKDFWNNFDGTVRLCQQIPTFENLAK